MQTRKVVRIVLIIPVVLFYLSMLSSVTENGFSYMLQNEIGFLIGFSILPILIIWAIVYFTRDKTKKDMKKELGEVFLFFGRVAFGYIIIRIILFILGFIIRGEIDIKEVLYWIIGALVVYIIINLSRIFRYISKKSDGTGILNSFNEIRKQK